jgi:virulence factor Mce-like protein
MKMLRNPTLWGVGTLVLVTVVALVSALLYVSPPGYKTVVFYTDDASFIHPGDQVRIAGISVGTVKDLSLESDYVRVRTRVENNAFVGEQSTIDVRMLTVVGGYYVNLVSLGAEPLGANIIPVERVAMPYNLMRTLADATKITNGVNPKPINESLNELQAGLQGDNLETLSAVIDAGNSIMSTVDRQRGQITDILNLSDEYIQSLSNWENQFKQLIRKVSIIEQTLVLYSKNLTGAIVGLSEVLRALGPVSHFYMEHRDRFLEKVRQWQERARMWADRSGLIVEGLRSVRTKLDRVLDAQNAPPELLATDLCIPVPGAPC